MNARKKRLVVGITGGIATGKSEVLSLFARHGFPALSADTLAHACLRRGHPVHRRVLQRFGRALRKPNGDIDRRALGEIVFRRPLELKWLERQIHPAVIAALRSFIRKNRGIIALDIPLLYEARLENLVDKSVVVSSSTATQIARLKRRNGLSPASSRLRIEAQLPLWSKRRRADYVIGNDGTRLQLRRRVAGLLGKLKEIS